MDLPLTSCLYIYIYVIDTPVAFTSCYLFAASYLPLPIFMIFFDAEGESEDTAALAQKQFVYDMTSQSRWEINQ